MVRVPQADHAPRHAFAHQLLCSRPGMCMSAHLLLIPAMSKPWEWYPDLEVERGRTRDRRRRTLRVSFPIILAALGTFLLACSIFTNTSFLRGATSISSTQRVPRNAAAILARCAALQAAPGPPARFAERKESDRHEPGTRPTLIRNATVWTGAHDGTEVIYGDVLLEKGIVKALGYVPKGMLKELENVDRNVVDAEGAWVTPGLGTFELNSPNGPILPWLRSIDGFHTHDEALTLAIAGGVTSVQVLPGSANAIGGQAFMLKPRKTSDGSPTSMIIEPPHGLNGSNIDEAAPLRWRHLKQSCGENLDRYGTRMDSAWSFRSAYAEAQKIKGAQDAYCEKAQAGLWGSLSGQFPEDLKWEALVDVLRGRVKISNHCYEAVDIDAIVRLSNEFKFPIASFHHAAEAYLVPDILKRTWGGTPAVALFASTYRNKRESFRGSVFAPRVLADNNISVIMKAGRPPTALPPSHLTLSDRPPRNLCARAPLSSPAGLLLRPSRGPRPRLPHHHPCPSRRPRAPHRAHARGLRCGCRALGLTPPAARRDAPSASGSTGRCRSPVPPPGVQYDEGAGSGEVMVGRGKDEPEWRELPEVPDWKRERKRTVEWEGLPPLKVDTTEERIVFRNVSEMMRKLGSVEEGMVVVEKGKVLCAGTGDSCAALAFGESGRDPRVVDLHGGALAPALISFGSPLGLEEIQYEYSTGDGQLYDAFAGAVPPILGDVAGVVRAADALQFQTRNALLAHQAGVTVATSFSHAQFADRVIPGLSTTFRTGSAHALSPGAIIQPVSALHYSVHRPPAINFVGAQSTASLSTRIAVLRRLLMGKEDVEGHTETGLWFGKAAEGVVPLVVHVDSADPMARLLELKKEVENNRGSKMQMVFAGATEAHLLAKEIGDAGVGVILIPSRPVPMTWDDRRILPGPPLTNDTAIVKLLEHNVLVGLGITEATYATHTRFDIAWAGIDAGGRITKEQAAAMASLNLERLLGIDSLRNVEGKSGYESDMVAYEGGGILDMSSKAVAIISGGRGEVDLI
ncbi:hypothetical protein EVG20_g9306 [Dentipellis fragilis]|uniref:Amidohydrolase-related domain-containing protein n=1 Tax=Dentipellis fragilis TaxID=205917 RepID=A0A4Y9Y266_9AGAM|nr:hypothetical protein EVG20_g9306 [Dentipellis fragilis]